MRAVEANFYEVEESELRYHEKRARLKKFWGTLREKALAENIISIMPVASRVLDVGSGDGYLSFRIFSEKKNFVVGSDISMARMKNAKKNFPAFIGARANVFCLPFRDNSFDVVACSQLLEHLKNWHFALKELLRVSKKSVIITVPFEQILIREHCPKCGAVYLLSGHINSFSKDSVKKAVNAIKRAKIRQLFGFHTIFSYNKETMKLPSKLRLFFDKAIIAAKPFFSFFKPNYLLARIDKK